MQNQPNCDSLIDTNLTKLFDRTDFREAHVLPYGKLWVDHPDTKLSWIHSHNHLEIGRCVKGSGTFNVDGKILRVRAPCCTILYEGEWHSAQSNPYDPCEWNYLYIDLNHYLSRTDAGTVSAIKGLQWQNYEFPTLMQREEYPEINAVTDLIFAESSAQRENGDDILMGLILALLTLHGRTMRQGTRHSADRQIMKRISPAISHINAHYAENITVRELADLCFTSITTLRRDFSEFSGMSPSEYLHKVRIKNAAVMLTATQKSILEIANDTGYPTVSSFNRQFSQAYGLSPRAYRKDALIKKPPFRF